MNMYVIKNVERKEDMLKQKTNKQFMILSVIAIIASFVFLVVFTLIISAVEFLKTTDYSVVNREKII